MSHASALPTVVTATYDRAFPHTLRVVVVPERPAAVLRRGAGSWLVSARGRVMTKLPPHARPRLPRIWLGSSAQVGIGRLLPAAEGGAAAHALGVAGAFARRVASAAYARDSLVFRLRSGVDLALGSAGDLRLKLAVAAEALPHLPAGDVFLDVSVPGRPVAGTAANLAAQGRTSSTGSGNKTQALVDSTP